jgi:hypothetical protein
MLTYADVCRRLSCSICVTCSRIWTRMRWLVCYYVSSYYYVCVRIPLYLCVLILLHMCPHTTIYVCSYCCVCARVSYYKYVSSFYYMCVLILLDICAHTTIGALTQQYVCSHAIKSVCSFHYVCVLILSYMCPQPTPPPQKKVADVWQQVRRDVTRAVEVCSGISDAKRRQVLVIYVSSYHYTP